MTEVRLARWNRQSRLWVRSSTERRSTYDAENAGGYTSVQRKSFRKLHEHFDIHSNIYGGLVKDHMPMLSKGGGAPRRAPLHCTPQMLNCNDLQIQRKQYLQASGRCAQFESIFHTPQPTYDGQSGLDTAMNTINESVFQKPKAQDDQGLEEEAKYLLNGKDVALEKDHFKGKALASSIAPTVLIHGDEGEGVIHSRLNESGIDILSIGPNTGSGQKILVLSDGRTGLVFRNVVLRRFLAQDA
ncbi:uncharacterized protein MYU51_010505 [Penicillium brevicompactum]